MLTLILGALDQEIEFLTKDLENKTTTTWNNFQIHKGLLQDKEVIITKTGIGKVLSTLITQYLIDTYKPDQILFTGVAGAINPILKIGDIVIAKDLVQHDFDTTVFGDLPGQIANTNYRYIEPNQLLKNKALKAIIPNQKIIQGRIATGDQFIQDTSKIKETFQADCVEMEGASVALTATINKIPFLVIRIISDEANKKAKSDYEVNLPKFAKISNTIIKQLLK